MFARFRQLQSGGRRPESVNARIFCYGDCQHRYRYTLSGRGGRLYGCPRKPRCKWRIGADDDDSPTLAPYRLQVTLAENVRRDGKVKQEHVAHLGAVDGHMLPSFFDGIDPAMAAKMKSPEWKLLSLRTRIEFWQQCKPKLARLANRIGPDGVKQIRMAIHARIPWPMEAERRQIEMLEAEEDLKHALSSQESHSQMRELAEKQVERARQQKAAFDKLALFEAGEVQRAITRVTRLKK